MTGLSSVVRVAAIPLVSEIKASGATTQHIGPMSPRKPTTGQLSAVAGAIRRPAARMYAECPRKDAVSGATSVNGRSTVLVGKP